MKRFNYIFLLFAIAAFSSCKKDLTSEGVSKVTHYPNFTVSGDAEVYVQLGSSYTDPGAVALAGTANLPVTTVVTGVYSSYSGSTVDATKANKYNVTYSAVNSDGFAGNAYRTVYVYKTGDLVNSIEGLYTSTVVRSGVVSAQYANMEFVMIWKTGANTYAISDGIGGYYDIGRGYGPKYMATGGTITANDIAANDFSFGTGCEVGSFGGSVTFSSLTVNAATKTLTLKSAWDAGYSFVITLKQVQF